MEHSNGPSFMIAFLCVFAVIGVIYKAVTYPVPQVVKLHQAEVVLVYMSGVGGGGVSYNCDLRLDTGLLINVVCFKWNKKGDKVLVAKLKGNKFYDSKYVVQEPTVKEQ